MRVLVGEDGGAIAEYMLFVMEDDRARTADRIEAGRWLADRGFGKAALVSDAGVNRSTYSIAKRLHRLTGAICVRSQPQSRRATSLPCRRSWVRVPSSASHGLSEEEALRHAGPPRRRTPVRSARDSAVPMTGAVDSGIGETTARDHAIFYSCKGE